MIWLAPSRKVFPTRLFPSALATNARSRSNIRKAGRRGQPHLPFPSCLLKYGVVKSSGEQAQGPRNLNRVTVKRKQQ
jgi:hypothetical protein